MSGCKAKKFENAGSITNSVGRGRIRAISAIEKNVHIKEDVKHYPETSCSRRASQLSTKKTYLWRIMKENLNLLHYKIQVVKSLCPLDIPRRFE